ncbi:hypothetical protein KHA80_05495 [Anaerobacillus sp. HL2]|nr:hypothetical protein KHA80_05495 [Anaerobacillus sp. HL2]
MVDPKFLDTNYLVNVALCGSCNNHLTPVNQETKGEYQAIDFMYVKSINANNFVLKQKFLIMSLKKDPRSRIE